MTNACPTCNSYIRNVRKMIWAGDYAKCCTDNWHYTGPPSQSPLHTSDEVNRLNLTAYDRNMLKGMCVKVDAFDG